MKTALLKLLVVLVVLEVVLGSMVLVSQTTAKKDTCEPFRKQALDEYQILSTVSDKDERLGRTARITMNAALYSMCMSKD